MIELRGLRVHFPLRRSMSEWLRRVPALAVRAVDGVDLQFGQGEIVALVGESGSGKTTTGRALVRLAPITGGQVLLDGQDVTAIGGQELRDYRRRVQIIFQDPYESLDPRRTIGDQVSRAARGPRHRHRGRASRDGSTRRSRMRACGPPRGTATGIPTSCPVASGSGWPSPAPWPWVPTSWSRTSRSRCSTSRSGAASCG